MASALPAMLQRLRLELRDAAELVLLPGLAAVLPWNVCFFIFKRLVRWRWLYQEPCETALRHARALGWAGPDEAHWLRVRKLVTLVDHADHYLGLSRGDAWMQRHLQVQGEWPAADRSHLLLTFHWGAGYWGLRHAAVHGLHPHALVASLTTHAYQGRWVLGKYARARNANVARVLKAETIDIAQQLKHVIRAIRSNESLLGVVDVPSDEAIASMPITLLGLEASVPRGLLRLAVDKQVPVVLYTTGLNTLTGKRTLQIQCLVQATRVEDLATTAFSELERLIAQDAPAWHFWGIAERFFRRQGPPSYSISNS